VGGLVFFLGFCFCNGRLFPVYPETSILVSFLRRLRAKLFAYETLPVILLFHTAPPVFFHLALFFFDCKILSSCSFSFLPLAPFFPQAPQPFQPTCNSPAFVEKDFQSEGGCFFLFLFGFFGFWSLRFPKKFPSRVLPDPLGSVVFRSVSPKCSLDPVCVVPFF